MIWSTCQTCGEQCFWQDCPTGGWWVHLERAPDGHDAQGRPEEDAQVAAREQAEEERS